MTTEQHAKDNAAFNDLRMLHSEWLKFPMTQQVLGMLQTHVTQLIVEIGNRASTAEDKDLRGLCMKLQAYVDVHKAMQSVIKIAETQGFPIIKQPQTK